MSLCQLRAAVDSPVRWRIPAAVLPAAHCTSTVRRWRRRRPISPFVSDPPAAASTKRQGEILNGGYISAAAWARIFKLYGAKEFIQRKASPTAYVAWLAGTTTLFYSVSSPHRLLKNSSSDVEEVRIREKICFLTVYPNQVHNDGLHHSLLLPISSMQTRTGLARAIPTWKSTAAPHLRTALLPQPLSTDRR